MWLEDSFRCMDLVVVGTPHKSASAAVAGGEMEIEQILYGSVHPSLRLREGAVRILHPRFNWEATGVWILIRTPMGYADANPSSDPLSLDEWNRTRRASKIEPLGAGADLTERESTTQLRRTRMRSGKEVNHGCLVEVFGGVSVDMFINGDRSWSRRWDEHGRLELVIWRPASGPGFLLRYRGGKLLEFERTLDGKEDGLSRGFYFSKGLPREEAEWKNGLRNGWSRTWNENGVIEWEQRYEDNLAVPVVRYRGKEPSEATIHRSRYGTSYGGPMELMGAFRVGMTTREVSRLLKLDFSEKEGIYFPAYRCEEGLQIDFENGRVSSIHMRPNGSFCEEMR
jgi:hypothetical protein